MAHRENFTAYEIMPEDLAIYLSHNGPHFNKAAFEFAVKQMYTVDEQGNDVDVIPYSKKDVDNMLARNAITIKNNKLYDATYLANMAKADFLGSSIPNEQVMVKWIKDVLDDPDGMDGLTFNRWIADMKWLGIPIPWDEFL